MAESPGTTSEAAEEISLADALALGCAVQAANLRLIILA